MQSVLARLNRRKSGIVGLVIIAACVALAVLAPWIAPHDHLAQQRGRMLESPSGEYLLGTDHLGRDLLSRIIWGTRISMLAGLVAVGLGMAIGVTLGVISGYCGGKIDYAIVGLADVVWSFPEVLLAIALTAVLGPGLVTAMIALGLVTWPQYARVVRGQFMALRSSEFVEAARALGASDWTIAIKHVLPNSLSPVIVVATFGMATAILVEATLSYLGLGVQPPSPSWGSILQAGKNFVYQSPLMSVAPGVSIMLVVLGFNMFGDALRDILDPRLRGRM